MPAIAEKAKSIGDAIREQLLAALNQREQIHKSQSDAVVETMASGGQVSLEQRLNWFTDLENLRRELEKLLASCKEESTKLEPQILEDMALANMKRANVNGLTVFPKTDFYCNKATGVSAEKMAEILEACGYGDLVAENYSAASLKSRVKEKLGELGPNDDPQQKLAEVLPPALAEVLKVGTVTRLSTQAS